MPDFDLDAALSAGPHDVFVMTQQVYHRGQPNDYHLLMIGPDAAGMATAVAMLSVSGSGWVNLSYWGPRNRWRRMRSPAEVQAIGEHEAATGATERHHHSQFRQLPTCECYPVAEWWRKVGGQSA
jgi:hypothetical protein